jgi:hypothetical protein
MDEKPESDGNDFIAYDVEGGGAFIIRPAPVERAWMDGSKGGFAYRCLPLTVANQLGWEILCPVAFTAVWDGRIDDDAVSIRFRREETAAIVSHFGCGIVTFRIGILFRTPPGHDLWVSGPVNRPKDGIAPLEALIETDWLPFTFTMNWQLTRPGHEVTFEAGEPIARVVPYPRGYVERFEPTLRSIDSDTTLRHQYQAWRASRTAFMADLAADTIENGRSRWQKHYTLGTTHDGTRFPDHRTKLVLRPFARA